MKVKFLNVRGTWREVANSARTTINKEHITGDVSDKWKKRMLLAEHSPIRKKKVAWKWEYLPYWVSTHFVRHKVGIEHWVRTQRTDRTGEDRNDKSQGANVEHECEANAQSLITISRKRLCSNASEETREAWKMMLEKLKEDEPELVECCVPDCIYRGFCYEYESCNWHNTHEYTEALESYRRVFCIEL